MLPTELLPVILLLNRELNRHKQTFGVAMHENYLYDWTGLSKRGNTMVSVVLCMVLCSRKLQRVNKGRGLVLHFLLEYFLVIRLVV